MRVTHPFYLPLKFGNMPSPVKKTLPKQLPQPVLPKSAKDCLSELNPTLVTAKVLREKCSLSNLQYTGEEDIYSGLQKTIQKLQENIQTAKNKSYLLPSIPDLARFFDVNETFITRAMERLKRRYSDSIRYIPRNGLLVFHPKHNPSIQQEALSPTLQQAYDLVTDYVKNSFQPGESIVRLVDLAKEFGVSYSWISLAAHLLTEEGVLERIEEQKSCAKALWRRAGVSSSPKKIKTEKHLSGDIPQPLIRYLEKLEPNTPLADLKTLASQCSMTWQALMEARKYLEQHGILKTEKRDGRIIYIVKDKKMLDYLGPIKSYTLMLPPKIIEQIKKHHQKTKQPVGDTVTRALLEYFQKITKTE